MELHKIEKKKKGFYQERVISPARWQEYDTGNKREHEIIKADGTREKKIVPLMEKVFKDAIKEDVYVEMEVYCVFDGDDTHEFSSENDAKNFLLSVGRD